MGFRIVNTEGRGFDHRSDKVKNEKWTPDHSQVNVHHLRASAGLHKQMSV